MPEVGMAKVGMAKVGMAKVGMVRAGPGSWRLGEMDCAEGSTRGPFSHIANLRAGLSGMDGQVG